jgi:hypothetical protein
MHALGLDMLRLDKPVIAAINGVAGGLTLALFADIRVAGAGARIGDTSGKVGLLAEEGEAWLFPRRWPAGSSNLCPMPRSIPRPLRRLGQTSNVKPSSRRNRASSATR